MHANANERYFKFLCQCHKVCLNRTSPTFKLVNFELCSSRPLFLSIGPIYAMYSGNVSAADSDALVACLEGEVARMEEAKAPMQIDKARAEAEIRHKTGLLSGPRFRGKWKNSASPIFRLPPEILEIVFTHGARDFHESHDGGRFITYIPTWVNVSYVCSDWRNIALNCPTLWIYPFHMSRRWTEELLLRSKEAPLKVSCIYPRRRYKSVGWRWGLLDNLLKHSERIQEFCLDVPLLSPLPPLLSLSAPRLEKLEMSFWRRIPMQSIAIADGEKLPLHTLKLANCSLSWCSLNLTGLQTLSLSRIHSPSPLDIAEFLTILNNMQGLTLINLEHVLPSARVFLSSGGFDISPKINLPRLALLAVTAPLSTVVALLSRICIPLKTQLSLKPLLERDSSIDDYSSISLFLAQRFSIPEPPSSSCQILRSLVVNFDPKLTFSSLERDWNPSTPSIEKHIPLQITLGEEETDDAEEMTKSDAHRIMSNICCSMPLINVQTLCVHEPKFSSAIWKEILGSLNGLRYMMLCDGWMPDLSMLRLSLSTNEPKENPGGQAIHDQDPTLGRILVPALEELELVSIIFIPDDATPRGARMSQKSLFDVLSTRKGLRDRVTMTNCDIRNEPDPWW